MQTALHKLKVSIWPYPAAIGIKEGDDLHIFDHWCYLGSAMNENEVEELLRDGAPEFDLDIYKLIKKSLRSIPATDIVDLQNYHAYSSIS